MANVEIDLNDLIDKIYNMGADCEANEVRLKLRHKEVCDAYQNQINTYKDAISGNHARISELEAKIVVLTTAAIVENDTPVSDTVEDPTLTQEI